MKNRKLEICVYSFESAVIAQQSGADRIELCAGLPEGGTTPSYATIKKVCNELSVPVHVIIRPRGGDFLYSSAELDIMREDICMAKHLGAAGIVTGVLDKFGNVDKESMRVLMNEAAGLSVTFHRAFDMTNDPFKALEDIIGLGCGRILTSGQQSTALKGKDLLKELVEKSAGRVIIMPGCGITPANIKEIMDSTNAPEYHFSARESKESLMEYRNPAVSMGGTVTIDEYRQDLASGNLIESVKDILRF